MDSTVRKGNVTGRIIDPEYPSYAGMKSAITGIKIKELKAGEAIVSEEFADRVLHSDNPIGTVQTLTSEAQPIQVTIVDVFESLPLIDMTLGYDELCYCTANTVEEECSSQFFQANGVYVVLKKGAKKEQLLNEINQRLKPLNVEADIFSISQIYDSNIFNIIRPVCYFIGCLILIAAIIGYLRMQIQLIWIRRREMTLRVVNGASRWKLFELLIIENAISLALAIGLAVILGTLVREFLENRLSVFMIENGIRISHLWPYSLLIGGGLLIVCGMISAIIINRISTSKQGLAVNMRKSRNHLFRNVMLGIQILICFVFVCSALVCINFLDKMLKPMIPENDSRLREYLYIKTSFSEDKESLYAELKRLPELDRIEMLYHDYYPIKEIRENREKLNISPYLKIYCISDTSVMSTLGINTDWRDKRTELSECLLLQDSLMNILSEAGVGVNNILTIEGIDNERDLTLPIAGLVGNVPYESYGSAIIAISPRFKDYNLGWILIPKKGKGKALARSVKETVEKLEPEAINQMVFNYKDSVSIFPGYLETLKTGCWVGDKSLAVGGGVLEALLCLSGVLKSRE